MKVSELEGKALDAWVAKALGYKHLGAIGVNAKTDDKPWCLSDQNDWWEGPDASVTISGRGYICSGCYGFPYNYSTDWAVGGPIVEQSLIQVCPRDGLEDSGRKWVALINLRHDSFGSTPLVAAMRAFVASKFGETVDVAD